MIPDISQQRMEEWVCKWAVRELGSWCVRAHALMNINSTDPPTW